MLEADTLAVGVSNQCEYMKQDVENLEEKEDLRILTTIQNNIFQYFAIIIACSFFSAFGTLISFLIIQRSSVVTEVQEKHFRIDLVCKNRLNRLPYFQQPCVQMSFKNEYVYF